MDLSFLLPHTHIVLDLKGKTRAEILNNLSQPLFDENIVTDSEQFIIDLEEREDMVTTVVDEGVAFPHARTDSALRMALTVGLVRKGDGIQFCDDGTKEPCKLFFLIAIPTATPAVHLNLLQHLAKFANNPKKIEKLLKSKTEKAAAKYLISFKP